MRSGRVLSTASVLESECITFLVSGIYQPGIFLNPVRLRFLEVSSFRNEQSLPPFSVLLSQENRGEAENSRLLVLCGDKLPFWSPPRVASLEQNTLLLTRKFKVFQEPCVSNWGQRPNMRTKVASNTLIT